MARIEIKRGDILKQDAEALVNTVNCVGVMGRGIALQFRRAYPENFESYQRACKIGGVRPGRMFVHDLQGLMNPRFIINFPTKRHWKGTSSLSDIKDGLVDLVDVLSRNKIRSVAIPPLGCGLGGLDWSVVRPLIEKALMALPNLHVYLYEPDGAPSPELMVKPTALPKMTMGRAALLGLMERYLSALMDVSISLLEIHKLMYFLQEAGENLRLKYSKAPYGPYAENLRHVLLAIEGHFITGYGEGADAPTKQIEIMGDSASRGMTFLEGHVETRRRFDRVAELIAGFETPFGMELLSTVHWVASRERASDADEAVHCVYAWNEHKRMFTHEQIGIAWETLSKHGWIASRTMCTHATGKQLESNTKAH